jgi:hypothetical protein
MTACKRDPRSGLLGDLRLQLDQAALDTGDRPGDQDDERLDVRRPLFEGLTNTREDVERRDHARVSVLDALIEVREGLSLFSVCHAGTLAATAAGAPDLTPAERAEADRFGMFDEDILGAMESQFETPCCAVTENGTPCAEAATYAMLCNHCDGFGAFVCAAHARFLETTSISTTHAACRASHPRLFRAVQL